MAIAGNTFHRSWSWPLVARSSNATTVATSCSAAATPRTVARTRTTKTDVSRPWRRPRLLPTTTAKAGAAGARPSSPDAVSYSSGVSTDIPLYEPHGVSFDEYLRDRARVFRAMFPDQSRSQRLNDEEWMIQMLPLQFLLLTVHPVVVMQLRHRGGVLELRATKWELRGLDSSYMPKEFDLGVEGSLYAERSSRRHCRLKGRLEITISCVLPPALSLVPASILRGVAESVLSSLAEKMKRDVDVGVIADFHRFRREKIADAEAAPTTPRVMNARAD